MRAGQVLQELQGEADWYKERIGDNEWKIACEQVATLRCTSILIAP